MTIFWIVAGLLIAGALLFVLAPLLRSAPPLPGAPNRAALVAVYRDQLRELDADVNAGVLSRERYGEARGEIERRLLDDVEGDEGDPRRIVGRHRLAAILTGVVLPLAAVGLYFAVGNPRALAPAGAVADETPHSLDARQVEAMVGRLAVRMQQNPEDVEGWVMLARSYTSLRRYDDAARAYASAVARLPTDAQLLADYADLLAMTQGRRLQGEPEKIVLRALAVDPKNVKALALAGSVAFEKHEYAGALDYWERIVRLVPPESEFARSIRGSIAQAQALAQNPAGGSASAPRP